MLKLCNFPCIKKTVSTLCIPIPAYRTIVEKMLQDLQTLENIITAASGLDHDPVAIEIDVWARDLKMTKLW